MGSGVAREDPPARPPPCIHAHASGASPKGHYSRLFGLPAQPIGHSDEAKLMELGKAMRYPVDREPPFTPRTGFTYFGQFLGHDLTHETTPLDGPFLEPEQTPNYRTPKFDLDHVYGRGPAGSAYLYEGEEGAETFKIGHTIPGGYPRDLPIEHGHVLIGDLADRRDLDNLILRQLHVLFLKFHNEAVRQLQENPELEANAGLRRDRTLFERARRLVCWHYQWIIRHDYLPRVVDSGFWARNQERVGLGAGQEFQVPIEFSLAAFRFGHSMVRNTYALNCRQRRVLLEQLMALGHRAEPIPDGYVLEWGAFLDGLPTSITVASSHAIDTSVSHAMHGLSPGIIRLSSERETIDPANLPVRTLLRGARARLASGQEVAEALVSQNKIDRRDQLMGAELSRDTCDRSGSVLWENALHENTPLFYYILKEAELKTGGTRLGPVGSYIVAEVIQRALECDRDGYLASPGEKWQPPAWRFPSGARRPVSSLFGIVRLVGDDKLLPDCEVYWQRSRRRLSRG